MIKTGDILTLKIEKVVYEGFGLARFDNRTVFVKDTVDGDIVRAKVVFENKSYIKAKLHGILEPSCHRVKPLCALSKPCGGCDFSHIDYDYQLKIKENIVKEIFRNIEGVEFLPILKSPLKYNYRFKTQYPVSQTKKSKRLLIGYYKEKTHEIINIKYCPIHPEIIDKITDFIKENWKLGAYDEKTHKGLLRHVNIRISNLSSEILLTLVLNINEIEFNKIKEEINNFCNLLTEEFKSIKGINVNFNDKKTNKITGEKNLKIKGCDYIIEGLSDKKYKIGFNSFFQVNPLSAELLFKCAHDFIDKKGCILDLYGGCGAIGIFLSDMADKIVLIESDINSIKFAKENYQINNIKNYEILFGFAQDKIKEFEEKTFENVIIDPPRKGSDNNTLNVVSKITNSVIYISCNPMTLKRDAMTLIENGFELKKIQIVDMFPNTHHIECVSKFVKKGN